MRSLPAGLALALLPLAALASACGSLPETAPREASRPKHTLVEDPPLAPSEDAMHARDLPEIRGLVAEEGLIVVSSGTGGATFALEHMAEDGTWTPLARVHGDGVWVGAPVQAPARLRATSAAWVGQSVEAIAQAPTLELRDATTPPALLEGDELTRSAAWIAEGLDLGPINVVVSLTARDQTLYLPAGCEEVTCWSSSHTPFASADTLREVPDSINVVSRAPALGPAVGSMEIVVSAHVGEGSVRLASTSMEVRALGGRWRWGDLHAHSRWSNDGCEDGDAECGPRGDAPAEDFFANAAAVDLDFAAITDHAEYEWYLPDGDTGDEVDVWDGQAGTVADAASGETLPILGYEWTNTSDETEGVRRLGSHRTVLLADPSACEDYRVGAEAVATRWTPALGEWAFLDDGGAMATTPAELWADLDAAEGSCGTAVRWISFAHHPAYDTPQCTDWLADVNRPDRERLVEIYSEHGCSECEDTTADGCDFALNSDQRYYADGAVQTALDQGFELGFLAGTDSHDSRPGSLDDGPSMVAWFADSDGDGTLDTPRTQFDDGGLTGALVGGAMDAEALFDALEDRRTAATSGPRPELRVYLLDSDNHLYPMGSEVPAVAGPFTVVLEALPLDDTTTGAAISRIDRLSNGGAIVDSVSDVIYEATWSPSPGDYTYLRIRYTRDDGTEDRVWISPWFAR